MHRPYKNNRRRFAFLIFSILVICLNNTAFSSPLEIHHYSSKNSGISEISVIILGEKEAILIDSQWKPSDAKNVAMMIADSGRTLTHILIKHDNLYKFIRESSLTFLLSVGCVKCHIWTQKK